MSTENISHIALGTRAGCYYTYTRHISAMLLRTLRTTTRLLAVGSALNGYQ